MVNLYYIQNGFLSFGSNPILQDISLNLAAKDKICLIGRNGSGKSTLMKIISQEYQLDQGDQYISPKASIGYLKQEAKLSRNANQKTIYDFLNLSVDQTYRADMILSELKLEGNMLLDNLSGGLIRRVSIAYSLVHQPDILLLDEPTNHLDISTIQWLENYIKDYPGAVLCVSHDKMFLENITNKVWWLDRGRLRASSKGFKYFFDWQEEVLEQEEREIYKLGKKLQSENVWLQQGVTGRRKRNQGRLAALYKLREQLKSQKNNFANSKNQFDLEKIDSSQKSKLLLEADKISFIYGSKIIFKQFSIRILKGEKIGVIGPNGSGKTTLLRMLVKDPNLAESLDAKINGKIKHAANLNISYFDQNRSELNPKLTVMETLCPIGSDQIFFENGKNLHVGAYLKRFAFDPKVMYSKVASLSGGQASRLILAKLLINPGNILILDEPTNDLDMDSLEALQDILNEYTGTLVIVSHDRNFLESIVTRTIAFTPEGVLDMIGGYKDYESYYEKHASKFSGNSLKVSVKSSNITPKQDIKDHNIVESEEKSLSRKPKLSYKYQRIFDNLPSEIMILEEEIKTLEAYLALGENYSSPNSSNVIERAKELVDKKNTLESKVDLWLKLDSGEII